MLVGVCGALDVRLAAHVVRDEVHGARVLVLGDGVPGVPRLPEGEQHPAGDPDVRPRALAAPGPAAVVVLRPGEALDVGPELALVLLRQAIRARARDGDRGDDAARDPLVRLPGVGRKGGQLLVEGAHQRSLERDLERPLPGDDVVRQVERLDDGCALDHAPRRGRLDRHAEVDGEAQLDRVAVTDTASRPSR